VNWFQTSWQWLRGQWLRWFGPRHTPPIHVPLPAAVRVASAIPENWPSVVQPAPTGSKQAPAPRTWRGVTDSAAPASLPEALSEPKPRPEAAPDPLAALRDPLGLKLDNSLGRPGGQGTVYALHGFPGFVYKEYRNPITGAHESFDELILAGQDLAPMLEQVGVSTVWPLLRCGKGDVVDGYVMPRISDRFKIDIQAPRGVLEKDATLDHALLIGSDKAFHPARQVTSIDRLRIVRLVGVFLDALHREDLVYGDLSLKNMMFARDPVSLLVMDLDGVHRISTPLILVKDVLHTPDWNDPSAPGQLPRGFDLDRYRYALLVYRLLVANDVSASFPTNPDSLVVPTLDGLEEESRAALEFLLRRAADSHGEARPPVTEWLSALAAV